MTYEHLTDPELQAKLKALYEILKSTNSLEVFALIEEYAGLHFEEGKREGFAQGCEYAQENPGEFLEDIRMDRD